MRRKLSLKEIQKIEFDLLCQFDAYCRSHNLNYYLCGGTLLGAVRHKGFIPWDDDIDVMMARPEYERLLSELEKDAPFPYSSARTGNGVYPFLKILKSGTWIELDPEHPIGQNSVRSIVIDIFPIDGMPESEKKIKRIYAIKRVLVAALSLADAPSDASARKIVTRAKTKIKTLARKIAYPVIHLFKARTIGLLLDKFSRRYPFDYGRYVGGIVWGYGPCERMEREKWIVPVKVCFEGREFDAPACWHEYLSGLYGDYMTLPPEEKRPSHFLNAWIDDGADAI